MQHRRWVQNRLARRSVGPAAGSHRKERARGSADNLLDRPCSTQDVPVQMTVQMNGRSSRTFERAHTSHCRVRALSSRPQ